MYGSLTYVSAGASPLDLPLHLLCRPPRGTYNARIIVAVLSGSTIVEMPAAQFPPQTDALKELLCTHHIDVTDEQVEMLDRYRRLL
ncbi:MAG TPA: hypothetical protein VHE81_22195, partial [Lacipirellulaceae bacterium]|nr:hypothetical protein [Lacipirellulaceae bacterium]